MPETRPRPPGPARPLETLTLAQLRAYRRLLLHEDDRVGYWRRVVHARLDLAEAQRSTDHPLGPGELALALGDTGNGRNRRVLMALDPAEPLPELPGLDRLWTHVPDPADPDDLRRTTDCLRDVEMVLTAYRRCLHARLDEATSQLVQRYRQDPTAALDLLPPP